MKKTKFDGIPKIHNKKCLEYTNTVNPKMVCTCVKLIHLRSINTVFLTISITLYYVCALSF